MFSIWNSLCSNAAYAVEPSRSPMCVLQMNRKEYSQRCNALKENPFVNVTLKRYLSRRPGHSARWWCPDLATMCWHTTRPPTASTWPRWCRWTAPSSCNAVASSSFISVARMLLCGRFILVHNCCSDTAVRSFYPRSSQ